MSLQNSSAEAVVPAAAEDQDSTPAVVAKPVHASSGATPGDPNTSSYAPVALAPGGPKSSLPIEKVSHRDLSN